MGILTRDAEIKLLRWMLMDGVNPINPFQQPIYVRLVSSNGNETTPGVEVVGDSYDPEPASWGITELTPGVTATNGSEVSFSMIDTTTVKTVAGIELWDSSENPQRLALASLGTPIQVPAGSSFVISSGQIKVKLV